MFFLICIISIIGSLALLLVIYIIISYNRTCRVRTLGLEAFSTMDVYLQKRWDLLPKILDVVKGYAKHEYETLKDTIYNRNYNDIRNDDKIAQNTIISNNMPQLMTVVEDYPELKAVEGFNGLLNEIELIENEIATSRKYYNGVVRIYNTRLVVFPSNIVAKIFHFEKMKMYEANNREDVKL